MLTELEVLPLEGHELDTVRGGMAPAVSASVQDLELYGRRPDNTFGGNSLFGAVYRYVIFPSHFG